jgi:EAL domain-containing protein (putative c-di-GMP-specific phosphodiesterase class I)
LALYAAKADKGRSGRFWRLFKQSGLGGEAQHRGRGLLRSGGLEVYFQPVLSLEDETIVAVEALARLRDGGAIIHPQDFLPDLTLDDRGLLFRQVLELSIATLCRLDALALNLNVSVNLDGHVLMLDTTLPYLTTILNKTGIEPRRVVLELLESHEFLNLKGAAAQIKVVRALGVRIALDDLGAGYSSFLKIRDLPLDVVKLDRSFVAGLHEQPNDLIFISGIESLTASMGIKLIVEGVEDEQVLDALRVLGVRHVQGYVVAEPMEGSALADWLRHYQPRKAPKTPETLLSAYAMHTNWVRAFEFWRLNEAMLTHLHRNNPFSLRPYFAGPGACHHAAGDAYREFEALLLADSHNRGSILKAAGTFRRKLIAALERDDTNFTHTETLPRPL